MPAGQGRRVVSAFVATAFAQDDADSAKAQWRQVADQLRPKAPRLVALMDEAEHDVLAYMSFPREHRELWPRVGDGLREGGGVSWGVTKPPGLQARSDTP